jgi:hypothetical protein
MTPLHPIMLTSTGTNTQAKDTEFIVQAPVSLITEKLSGTYINTLSTAEINSVA